MPEANRPARFFEFSLIAIVSMAPGGPFLHSPKNENTKYNCLLKKNRGCIFEKGKNTYNIKCK